MKLIFIRHGDAGDYTHPDSERILSDLGRQQAAQTGQWLAQYRLDGLITSPYVRARQTADIVNQGIAPIICDTITPNDEPMAGLDAIKKLITDDVMLNDGTVAVVCHMNIIAKMAALLTDEPISPFCLAEARVLAGVPLVGEMTLVASFVP